MLNIKVSHTDKVTKDAHYIVLANKKTDLKGADLPNEIAKGFLNDSKKEVNPSLITNSGTYYLVFNIESLGEKRSKREEVRRWGVTVTSTCNSFNLDKLHIIDLTDDKEYVGDLLEGILLTNYHFPKYKTKDGDKNKLKSISVAKAAIAKKDLDNVLTAAEATYLARTLINEPLSYLTAVQLSKEIQKAGKTAGFKVEVLTKAKIKALKMGGLLAVNMGSIDPPTFNIMEWKPAKAKNKKPLVLVGKGVVYDTGGLSLKPTANSMDFMKSDMGGAAAVIGAMYAVAKMKLPIHVIALVPSTDNRPGGNAYAPGDVIEMHNGMTVEVLNTDAEGRMILADALSYAQKYKPELVIDLATLTGAAARAIGGQGVVAMGTAPREEMEALAESGYAVHERIVEFPFWDEYGDMIKSDLADIKNVGGPAAGMITAGKFLEHFTDYNWIHLDIAGMAWKHSPDGYRIKNGTGVGVRLLVDFLKNRAS